MDSKANSVIIGTHLDSQEKDMKKTRQRPYPLRLEDDLTQWVRDQAKAGDRSMNAQLNRLIREAKEAAGQRNRK